MIRLSALDLILDPDSKMNIPFKLVVPILLAVTTILFTGAVYSADNEVAIKMGMVNMTQVTRGSLLAKDIARKIDAKRRKFMSEIKTEEASLRKLNGELQKKGIILTPESFAEEKRKFNIKRTALKKMVQVRNQRLLNFRRSSDIYWNKSMQAALTDVIKKHGYNLVLRFTPELVLVRPMYMDISKLVLDQLNKNISKYNVTAPLAKMGK
jgi:Skp family chaperone for outer membrane proteins